MCTHYGHTSEQCSHCTSDRCANMPESFWDLADVHLLSEGTAGVEPPDFVTNFSYELTDAHKNKMSMFTYNATVGEWKHFIDAAAKNGFSKFWVSEAAPGGATTSFLTLPTWFEEMVGYIKDMNQIYLQRPLFRITSSGDSKQAASAVSGVRAMTPCMVRQLSSFIRVHNVMYTEAARQIR